MENEPVAIQQASNPVLDNQKEQALLKPASWKQYLNQTPEEILEE
jgi:hypothetical protein